MSTNHLIIGVAGHIDHGKTELVKALTGADTDRLVEEKERGISIDIGFASFWLPNGMQVSVVDVPGHERFVKNMLAGATGIDLLLLVVAADDGVMAQTVEHLAIAELLGVTAAVVVVNKIDVVSPARVGEVVAQVADLLAPTVYRGAPVVPASAKQRLGRDALIAAIETQAGQATARKLDLPPRLPIDRSFVLPGAGRVVTGTLWSGVLTTSGPLELLPSGRTCRPRRLEVHGKQVTKALAGQRVAVNIVISGPAPKRGDFLVPPATFSLATELIVRARVLPQAVRAIKTRSSLRLYHGAREVQAVCWPIGVARIEPGESGYLRLVLSEPVAAAFRDNFILRGQTPTTTVGGGIVLETGRRRIGKISTAHLDSLTGDDSSVIRDFLTSNRAPLTLDEIAAATHLGAAATEKVVSGMVEGGRAASLAAWRRTYFLDSEVLSDYGRALHTLLAEFYIEQPYQPGMRKEAVQRRLWPDMSSSQADILAEHFVSTGTIYKKDGRLSLAGRGVSSEAAASVAAVKAKLSGFAPPDLKALANDLGLSAADFKALLVRLAAAGDVVAVTEELYFSADAIAEAEDRLLDFLAGGGEISVSQFKDLLGTTRKYAVPLIEYFDRQKVTRRVGDARVIYDPTVEE